MGSKNPKVKVLVFASGRGSTFEALVQFSKTPQSHFEIVGLVSDQRSALVLSVATKLGIPAKNFSHSKEAPHVFFEQALNWAQKLEAKVIALAGFLLLVRDPLYSAYEGRIVNTHPSLLPKYGGRGMYGENVHRAVLEKGEKVSGVTIHSIDSRFDEGDILAQMEVPVHAGDTVTTLSERVREAERKLYPEVLNQFVTSPLRSC